MNEQAPLPPKIAAAIVAIMGAVPKLERTEKNTHGNYNFASIDDFLEAVRPLCAAHGLLIIQDEDSLDIPEGSKWMTMRYSYTLAHSSGETWGHRPTRTIMVNTAMGSQAFGAAQSYALKQFMRSLLQIATGERDEDADTHKPESLPAKRSSSKRGRPESSGGQDIRADSGQDRVAAGGPGTEPPGGQKHDADSGQNRRAAGGLSRADEARRRFMIELGKIHDIKSAAELDTRLATAKERLGSHYQECVAALQARVAALVRGRSQRPVEIEGETYEPPPAEDAASFADEMSRLEFDEPKE